ncbi:hypothetical protein M5K25_012057 [Dendrobium thyrsiflorum]|uniref:Uncharacterized protein n=1 Tax=Dendrobium thyrsiflorum TaxID=117978 RepID=A0ABD0UWR6_DENTH
MSSHYAMAAATQAKKDRHMVSWTQEEDDLLREQVTVHGSDNWTIIAANFKDKTGRQCRRRWFTYLNTECKKGGWSQEEDMLLCEAQKIFGNRWTEIAKVVSGRTDNAVKNRFSTLCKKRAKHHSISKENNDSCINPSNKKIMVEPSANKQQTGCGSSDNAEDFSSYERLATTHGISGGRSRPPLTVLTQNFNNLRCLSAQCHLDSSKACDTIANCEVQGNFLRRDDPKLTALLQQAELLSSLAVKAYSENKNQSLNDSWKELQNYLIQTREEGTLSSFSGMDFLLDNLEGVFEDFQYSLLNRDADQDGCQTSSVMSTGCTHDDLGINIDEHLLEHCSVGCNEGQSHQGTPAPVKFVCQGGAMPSSLELAQSSENVLVSSISEFDSPLKTIPPFHSFTEEIPSPEFSSSNSDISKSEIYSSNRPRSRDSTSAVHSNHSPFTLDLPLIYKPCHSRKSINRAPIPLEKRPKPEGIKREIGDRSCLLVPRPPSEFCRTTAGPPPDVGVPLDHHLRPDVLPDHHLRPDVLPDNHLRPNVLPDHHLRPDVSSDHHLRPDVLLDHHLRPDILPDHHLRPDVLPDHHLRPDVLSDHHLRPDVLPDHHLRPDVLPDRHLRPDVLPDHHLKPDVRSDHHLRPDVPPEHHLRPDVLPDHHMRPDVLSDHHLRPDVLLDHHLRPDVLLDHRLRPDVLPDHHLRPDVPPDHHLRPDVLLDHHLRPDVLADHHLRPDVLPDHHLRPNVLPDHHLRPDARRSSGPPPEARHSFGPPLEARRSVGSPLEARRSARPPHEARHSAGPPPEARRSVGPRPEARRSAVTHLTPDVLSDHRLRPDVLPNHHLRPDVLPDHHLRPDVLPDHHLTDDILLDHHLRPDVLPDHRLRPDPCHSRKSINRALIPPEKRPKPEGIKREIGDRSCLLAPRPPPEFCRTTAGPPPNAGVLPDHHLRPDVLSEHHLRPDILPDHHLSPDVLPDHHLRPDIRPDYHLRPDARHSAGPPPEARRSSGPPPESRRSAGSPPEARLLAGPPLEARRSAGPPPEARRSAGPPPDARRSAGTPPKARHSARPPPNARRSAGPPPEARHSAEPPPEARCSAGPLLEARRFAETLPNARRSAGPPPEARCSSGPPPPDVLPDHRLRPDVLTFCRTTT